MSKFLYVLGYLALLTFIIILYDSKNNKTEDEPVLSTESMAQPVKIVFLTEDEFLQLYDNINSANQVLLQQQDVEAALMILEPSKALVDSVFMNSDAF